MCEVLGSLRLCPVFVPKLGVAAWWLSAPLFAIALVTHLHVVGAADDTSLSAAAASTTAGPRPRLLPDPDLWVRGISFGEGRAGQGQENCKKQGLAALAAL